VFESVCFSYPDSRDDFQLDEISFSIPKGSLTALVGRSGSGKSTLIRLLTRFYNPTDGKILIDCEPIENFALSRFRRSLALVSQEPYLFDSTIRENILFGISDPPAEDELWHLLELTHCADFISQMVEGLDSTVGSGGNRLSQGQRQRIVIANALISKPEILILDEPTSALDSESEKAIQALLIGQHGKLTTLVIAHRLATIRHADQIVVLDQGRVISCARHEDLLRECEVYRLLFENQLIA
jgi:ABC-type multidrug transport system fused ATPase/permease subunit